MQNETYLEVWHHNYDGTSGSESFTLEEYDVAKARRDELNRGNRQCVTYQLVLVQRTVLV